MGVSTRGIAMQFRPLSDPPKGFVPCLIERSLDKYIKVNGSIQHGLTERRSQFVISFYSGSHWLGREEHWTSWAAIPPESNPVWNPAKLFAPKSLKPVLVILPQPVVLRSLIISPGLHFAFFDDANRTWKVYQRNQGARITSNEELINDRCWIDIGMKQISSWLELPEMELNARLRRD
jgi:hypothetical protein